jgi:superfamily II helicase
VARLYYDDLDHTIQEKMELTQNQYDPCIHNRWNGDEKVIMRVHVDKLKISSRSKERINEVIDNFRNVYDEITVYFGDEHNYLGMTLPL